MDEKEEIIILTDEDGTEQEFRHIDTVEYKGAYYVALAPAVYDDTDEAGEEEEVYIMKIIEENGEDVLEILEDEDELNEVFAEFQRLEDEAADEAEEE